MLCDDTLPTDLQQVLIAQHVLQLGVLRHMLSVREYDIALDSGELVLHLCHQVYKGEVHQDVLVLGVIHNVFKLLLKQPAGSRHVLGIVLRPCTDGVR